MTNTSRSLVAAAFPINGERLFNATVCGDDVLRTKPAPDPYLRAAALFDLEPAACLAIEDTPTGVASAEAAGVPVLALPYRLSIGDGAKRIVRISLKGLTVEDLRNFHRHLCHTHDNDTDPRRLGPRPSATVPADARPQPGSTADMSAWRPW